MAHSQKPDFVFRRNRRVYLNKRGASVQPTTGSRGVRISGSNAGYTMFRGSVKGTGYPLHSPVSPSLPLPASPCAITFQMDSNTNTPLAAAWVWGLSCEVRGIAVSRQTGCRVWEIHGFLSSWSRGSSVCIVTRLRSGRPSGRDSIPGRGNIYTPKRPRRLRCSPGSFIGGGGGARRPGHEADHSPTL